MTYDPALVQPAIALVAGIIILLAPRVLNYVIAIYLIVVGIVGLSAYFFEGGGRHHPGGKRLRYFLSAPRAPRVLSARAMR